MDGHQKEILWLRFSVMLPLIIPALCYGLFLIGFKDPMGISAHIMASGMLGGPPYALCAIIGLVYLWKKNARSYYRAALFAPLLFMPPLALFILCSGILGRVSWTSRDIVGAFGFSFLALPFGYAYVLIVFMPKIVRIIKEGGFR